MTWRRTFIISMVGVIVLVVVVIVGIYFGRPRTQLPATDLPLATLPPPLAKVEFPAQPVDYPVDWPSELRYPARFRLMEASLGSLPGKSSQGWSAKLNYQGDPESAADLLAAFFTSQGWQIAQRTEFDSGGFLLLIERDIEKGSGIVVIDPDTTNPETTKIVATIFP